MRHAFPAELHVDFFLSVLSQSALIRGFMLPSPLAWQHRQRWWESDIPHFEMRHINYKMPLPNISIGALLVIVIVTLIVVVPLLRKQRKNAGL